MATTLEFQEVDEIGEGTLDVIAEADRFNTWMYKTISRHATGKTLEIGSGIGNISQYFLNDGHQLMVTDIREGYCEKLKEKFARHDSYLGVLNMNLTDSDFEQEFADQLGQFDTVFALNVVEHIEDDQLALANAKKLLRKGGRAIILVPSYQALYNGFDTELGHFRRYTKSSLSKVFEANGFQIIHKQYFNFIGMFGWFVSGRILGNTQIPEGQMGLFNTLVPIFKIIDAAILSSAGLSTIVVGEKR